jgi:hypothetical protein
MNKLRGPGLRGGRGECCFGGHHLVSQIASSWWICSEERSGGVAVWCVVVVVLKWMRMRVVEVGRQVLSRGQERQGEEIPALRTEQNRTILKFEDVRRGSEQNSRFLNS